MRATFALAAALLLLTATSTFGLTFSDATLEPANWTYHMGVSFGDGNGYGSVALSAPGYFYGHLHSEDTWDPYLGYYRTGSIHVECYWLQNAAVYTPSTQGAISAINWQYNLKGSVVGTYGGGFYSWVPAIRQDGDLYVYTSYFGNWYDNNWHTMTFAGLTPQDFAGSSPYDPLDFSETGGQMEFGGWIMAVTGGNSDEYLDLYVNDWEVSVPEPSSLTVLASLLGTACSLRRAKRGTRIPRA
jgi:hypothetical protein